MATKYLNLSTDSTFSENSDYLIPSQKAIKTAVDAKQNKITTGEGLSLSEDGQLTNTVLDKTVLASNYVNPTLWKGTLAEYEALGTYNDNITYIITDDTDLEDMINDDVVSTSSTYSSSKINELLSNDLTNIQGGEYIDVIKPKGEILYEFGEHEMYATNGLASGWKPIFTKTTDIETISYTPEGNTLTESYVIFNSKLPEEYVQYLIPAYKEDGSVFTAIDCMDDVIFKNNGYDVSEYTNEEKVALFKELVHPNIDINTPVYVLKNQINESFITLQLFFDNSTGEYGIWGTIGNAEPINTIELESSDKALTIDWNEKALSMFENLSVDESNLVHKTENEEIAGVKTFKDSINFIGGDFQQDVLNNVLQYNAPNGATFVNTLVSNVSGETDTDGDGTAEKVALGIVYQGISNYTSSQELMNTIVPRQGVTPTTGYMIIEGEGSVFACGASAKDSITSKMFGLDETSGAKITQVSTGLIEASANSKFADGSIDSNAHLHIDAQLNQIDMSITNNLNSKTTGINLKDGVMTFTADSFVGLPEIPTKTSQLTNDSGYLTEHQDISGKADKSDIYTKTEVDTLIENVSIDESNLVHKSGNEELTGLKTISLVTTPLTLLDNNDLYNEEHYTVTSEIKVNDKVVKTQYSNTFEPEMLPGQKIPVHLEKIHNELTIDRMLAKGDISHFESTSEVPMSFTKLSLEYADTTSNTKVYDVNTEIQIAAGEYKVDVTDATSNVKSGIQLNAVTKHLVLTGDAAVFDSNTHQDAVPTIKYVKDLLSDITTNQLNNIYPIGSLYFCTQSTCPMATLISGSTWEKVGSSLITNVDTNVPIAGNGITLGLTNGTTNVGAGITSGASSISVYESTYGSSVGTGRGTGLTGNTSLGITTDATKSGIVGTVTRSALTVNIFKRTA